MIELEIEGFVVAGHDLRRQVFGLDQGTARGHSGLFQGVLELADVARPVVADQPRERLARERLDRQAFLGHLVEEMIDQQRDVFEPPAERGHLDRHHVQPVEEVFAKPARGHGVGQNHVGGSDHAAIGLDRVGSPHALESAVLKHAQQLRLHSQGHLADLVQEERAALREFEPPFLLAFSAGEGAALMAEQLAFEQMLGEGAQLTATSGPRRVTSLK